MERLDSASAGYKDDDARGRFYSGGAAFILAVPGLLAERVRARTRLVSFLPLLSTAGEKGTINWVNNIMVYKQTEHPKETLRFLRWWSENQKVLWTEGNAGGIPARQSFQQDPFSHKNAQLNEVIKTYLPVAKPLSATAGGILLSSTRSRATAS